MNNDFYITPCKSICEINRSSGLCIGCGRTREEIAKWATFTHEERMAIMKRLGYVKRRNRDKIKPHS